MTAYVDLPLKERAVARCVKHGMWIPQSQGRQQRIEPADGRGPITVRFHCGPTTEHIEDSE